MQKYSERLKTKVEKLNPRGAMSADTQDLYAVSITPMIDDPVLESMANMRFSDVTTAESLKRTAESRVWGLRNDKRYRELIDRGFDVEVYKVCDNSCVCGTEEQDTAALFQVWDRLDYEHRRTLIKSFYHRAFLRGQASAMMNMN